MLTIRTALLTAVLTVVALPSAAASAATVDPAVVSELAEAAIEAVAAEGVLLAEIAGTPTPASDDVTRLRQADLEGHALLEQLEQLNVALTSATRAALDRLPTAGEGFVPDPVVYEAAATDLQRIAATPSAALPRSAKSRGPALGLLAVAAISLLVLGAAALGNTLRRREDDDELAAMAWSDGLTGLSNRRRLDHDIAAHDSGSAAVAAIMIDVDHFKAVNDSFGHQEGDEVLRRVGTMLTSHVRFDDVVYRYGGEEFCILLPGATDEDAVRVAHRIVEAARTILLPDATNLTVSVGVAHGGETAAAACEAADQALLAAKSAGRDQLVDASTLELTTA